MAIFGSPTAVQPTPFELETFLRSWLSPIMNMIASGLTWLYQAAQFVYTQPPEISWKAMNENGERAWDHIVANAYTAGVAVMGILSFGYLYKKGYLTSPFKKNLGVGVDVSLPYFGASAYIGSGYQGKYDLIRTFNSRINDVHNHLDDVEAAITAERLFHLNSLNALGRRIKGNTDFMSITDTTSNTYRSRKYKPGSTINREDS